MSDTPNYAIWRPEHDGHAPPNWREGTEILEFRPIGTTEWRELAILPSWGKNFEYKVPPEALTAPKDDAPKGFVKLDEFLLAQYVEYLREYPADELAKHGITLAEPKDWATELITDFMQLAGFDYTASRFRAGRIEPEESAAIAFIRERVVLKEAIND